MKERRRTVYINEESAKRLSNGSISIPKDMPEEYERMAERGGYPFFKSSTVPSSDRHYFISLMEKAYKEAREGVISLGDIECASSNDPEQVLAEILNKIQEKESPVRMLIEKTAYNYIVSRFNVPEGTVQFEASIKGGVGDLEGGIPLKPEDSDFQFRDTHDITHFRNQVEKRRLLNMLCAGIAAETAMEAINDAEEIAEMDPELIELYRQYMILNNYLICSKPDAGLTERDKKQAGTVKVMLGNEDARTVIKADATSFPVLVYELAKGVLELSISHGLPRDMGRALSIIRKSDFANAEPWNMRLGPALWSRMEDLAGGIPSDMTPYLMMDISTLPARKFSLLMREVMSGTKKGAQMVGTVKDNIDYSNFLDRMDKADTRKNIIADEYIRPEELDCDE